MGWDPVSCRRSGRGAKEEGEEEEEGEGEGEGEGETEEEMEEKVYGGSGTQQGGGVEKGTRACGYRDRCRRGSSATKIDDERSALTSGACGCVRVWMCMNRRVWGGGGNGGGARLGTRCGGKGRYRFLRTSGSLDTALNMRKYSSRCWDRGPFSRGV